MFTLARWACIPFSLLGAYVCYRWAADLYGELAGAWSLVLWCFSPNILAHAQLITPDLGATALGVTAGYLSGGGSSGRLAARAGKRGGVGPRGVGQSDVGHPVWTVARAVDHVDDFTPAPE